MPDVLYRTNGDKAVVRKSVISGTGFAIGKDYQPESMHDGDIGITVRINREKLKGTLTPDQRAAAARIFREAVQEVGAFLGDDLQPGFAPGTVVTVGDAVGVVQSVNPSGLFLRRIDGRGKETTSFIPCLQRIDAVPDVTGMDGLLTAIARGDVSIHEERGFLKFIIERIDDEETLFAAVTRPAAGYHGAYEPAIAKINDPIRLANIIVALENHDVANGARNGKEHAAEKLTEMLPRLTEEQRRTIVELIEDTAHASLNREHHEQNSAWLEEKTIVILWLELLRAEPDGQEQLTKLALNRENVAGLVRETIIKDYLDDSHINDVARCLTGKISDFDELSVLAFLNRLPNNHCLAIDCVTSTASERLVLMALMKITDVAALEKLLHVHEKRDGTEPCFSNAIWKRLRDLKPQSNS